MIRQLITICLLLSLAVGQAFAVQAHSCDEMNAAMSHVSSDAPHDDHHNMANKHSERQTNTSPEIMDCCADCICPGSTCSSLMFTINHDINSELRSQQKQSLYQFSVIAAYLNLLKKPPITA